MTDKDIKNRIRDIETRKVHQCAEYLKGKGYFTGEELNQVLREYGVAYGYFTQLYHLDWKYVWIKKCEMSFEDFLRDIIFTAGCDATFRRTEKLKLEYYQNQYRLNDGKVEKYHQEYMYCVAFRKKDKLS